MSKAGIPLKIRVEDENSKLNKGSLKGFAGSGVAQSKRTLLCDVQNRTGLRALTTAKDGAQKSLVDGKIQSNLRNIKARVDTYRRPSEENVSIGSDASNANASDTNATTKPIGNALGRRKVLTRANSVRSNTPAGLQPASREPSLQRQAHALVGHNKPKPVTTKLVEQKVQQAKYATKPVKNADIVVGPVALRREDSNLSRKAMTQLKTALQRECQVKVPVAKPLPKVVNVPKTKVVVSSSGRNNARIEDLKITSVQSLATKCPSAVVDIDAGDSKDLILVSEYVNDIYGYLFELEEKQSIREHHLTGQLEVYPKTRAVLVDWINEVHVQFRLAGDTFQIAVAIIDRYLQAVKDTKRAQLQLVGVTALFIAAKYEELFPPAIADFVYITDNTYTIRQILDMELKMFKALDCNLSRPLPLHFLRRFSKAAEAEECVHGMAKYFVELSLLEYELTWYKPSEIAAASLFLTLQLLRTREKKLGGFDNSLWNSTLQWHSRYSADYLRPISRKIAVIAQNMPNAKLKAVYTKYQMAKFHKISQRAELYGPVMESITNSKIN